LSIGLRLAAGYVIICLLIAMGGVQTKDLLWRL
jgi:hypothetical protein